MEGEGDRTLERGKGPIPTPAPPSPHRGGAPAQPDQFASSITHFAITEAPESSRTDISTRIEPEKWAKLKGLMTTLQQAAGISGMEPVKRIIEGLVELIVLYEDAAQGQEEFDDLRVQLESIFDELSHHLSSSPVITISMESICWSMEREIEVVKSREARPRNRRSGKANDDASVILDCYRRIEDHLQRLTRNANTSTWKIVDQLATENRLQKLASSLWECYNSEKANELKRRSCNADTRMTVLSLMHRWVTDLSVGNVFWMSGMAGTGKTTIAYTLCEQLDTKDNRLLCASFFCSRSLPECRAVGRIIPSIAYQLARCSQPFRYALSKATEKDPDAHSRLPHLQFESLIVQPFSNEEVKGAFPTNMVVVIDALDECDDTKSTKQVLEVLLTKARDLPIRFVVSSRPEPAIRDQMEKNGVWVNDRIILHELDSRQVQTDIKTYLEAELAPISPSNHEIEQLVARAGVLFISAATLVRYIGYDNFGRNPQARLRVILAKTGQHVKAQTKDIDELYEIVLDAAFSDLSIRDEEREDMKLILDTVICAREPLTVSTLNGLLQLDDVDRVHAALRPLWSVLHVMGPNKTVTTLHASFPDYILDSSRSGTWHCDAGTHHQLLAQRCFECIKKTKPQFNICQLESSYLLDKEVADLDERVQRFIPSELRYSCQYWASHLNAAEPSTVSVLALLLSQFLSTHLLLWMEVRNLTHTFPATLGDLTAAKQWATRHGMGREMIDHLDDAWRFALTFNSSLMSQSTPHLYVSMLPLLPPSSLIRQHYHSLFRGLIGIEGISFERRHGTPLAQWKYDLNVKCMACSPDGNRIAVGGYTRNLRIDRIFLLDPTSGTLLLDLSDGKEAWILSIAFAPNSTHLSSGRSDGYISVWDITTGKLFLSPFKAHSNSISSILYTHDGAYIISASSEFSEGILIWDALSGNPAGILPIEHNKGVHCIAITSDDVHLVSGSGNGTIHVWDMHSGKLILDLVTPHDAYVTAIALSPDDSHIVSGTSDGKIYVWDSQAGQIMLGPLQCHSEWARSLSVSPDGTTIASISKIDGIEIWDATSGKLVSQLGPFSEGNLQDQWATYSSDGTLIIHTHEDGTIRLLDNLTAVTPSHPPLGHSRPITSIDVSPTNQHIVSGSRDYTLCIWDLTQGTLLVGPLLGHTGGVNMVRYSPDGSHIVSCGRDSTIRQWDALSGAVQGTPIHIASYGIWDKGVISATYSRDGTRIVSLTGKGAVSIWDSNDGQSVSESFATTGESRVTQAEFSPDGANVVAGYADGSIEICDVGKRQMVFDHRENWGMPVSSFALSPDGLFYAQFRSDLFRYPPLLSVGGLSLKTLQTGEQLAGAFVGHTDSIASVRFSADGTQLVSGSWDYTVHVWDIQAGQSLLGPLKGHTDVVHSVAFSPDGKFVVSASNDSTIRVWNIKPEVPSDQDRDAECANWVLDKDGWVVSGSSRRLFWVPAHLYTSLMSPRNTTLISREGSVRLNFKGACIGRAWADCWCNV